MRITMNTVNRHMQHVLQNRYSDLSKLQEELATGKRLMRPSDVPIDVSNDIKLRSKVTQTAQYKKNIEDGMAFMSVSDTAMVSMNTLMQRIRELAIEGSNDTMTSNERIYIQKEVEQLIRQMVALADTNYKGDYVFGGTQSKIVPYPIQTSRGDSAQDYTNFRMAYYDGAGQIRNAFDNTPITKLIPGTFQLQVGNTTYVEGTDYTLDYVNGIITPINPALLVNNAPGSPNYVQGGFKITFDYVGQGKDIYGDPASNSGDVLREIEPDTAMAINIPGSEIFTDPNTGLDALEILIRFSQNLATSPGTVIDQSISQIDSVFKTILSAQSKNGARMNRFELTLDRNDAVLTETTRLQSDLEDADMAETISKYSMTETIYNAALKSAASVIQPSLVDYL
jgi:flagellar hook-associated protein 3 FlgL